MTTTRMLETISLALLLSLAAAPAVVEAQEAETVRLDAERVSIYNLAGAAEITGYSGSEVVVEVVRRGPDGGRLEMEVDRIDGREALRIRYPDDRIVYGAADGRSRTELRVSDRGTFYDGRSSGGERVRVSTYGDGTRAWADLRIRVPEGRDVALYLALGDTRVEGVSGRLRVDGGSGDVRARAVRGALTVDTGSGSVEVRDAEGDVLADTGSGSVEVRDVRGERLGGIRVSRLGVDTGSGSVRLARVAAPVVEVDTGSGSVFVELTTDVEDLLVDTGSGSVELRVPEGLGARLEVETGSGGIETDVPVRIRSARRNHLHGTLGDGEGRIRIDTGSGGVRIRGG